MAVTIPGWGDRLILVFILASGNPSLPRDPHRDLPHPTPPLHVSSFLCFLVGGSKGKKQQCDSI